MYPMLHYRQMSSEDQQTWELSKRVDWRRRIFPVILFGGIVIFVVISLWVDTL